MSTQEQNTPQIHELLCSVILGEATPEERARVEQALAESPELRAEYERTAATISLVQGSLGGPENAETLSPEVRATLHRAAEARRAPRWYASPGMRMAAGFALVAGLWGLYRTSGPGDTTPALEDGLAANDHYARRKNVETRAEIQGEARRDSLTSRAGEPDGSAVAGASAPERLGKTLDRANITLDENARGEGEFLDQAFESRSLEEQKAGSKIPSELGGRVRGAAGMPEADTAVSESELAELGVKVGAYAEAPTAESPVLTEPRDSAGLDSTALGMPVARPGGGGGGEGPRSGGSALSGGTFPGPTVSHGPASPGSGPPSAAPRSEQPREFSKGGLTERAREEDKLTLGEFLEDAEGAQVGYIQDFDVEESEALRMLGYLGQDEADAEADDESWTGGDNFFLGTGGATFSGDSKDDPASPAFGQLPNQPTNKSEAQETLLRLAKEGVDPVVLMDSLEVVDAPVRQRIAVLTELGAPELGAKGEKTVEIAKVAAVEHLAERVRNEVSPEAWNKTSNRISVVGGELELEADPEVIDEVRLYLEREGRFGGYLGSQLDSGRRQKRIELDYDRVVDDFFARCRRRPAEKPSAMFFRYWGDNAFESTQADALSTFSVDVDTASYTLAREYLSRGYLPEKAQVRTEEFVNAFAADVPAPVEDTFAIDLELAPSRFGEAGKEHWMMRVVVRGKEVPLEERDPLALTFVVDTSGSMSSENRSELVKHGIRLLLTQLDARDTIAMVAFSNEARLILPPTSADNRALIESAIHGLNADGSTNAEAGIKMGYAQAVAMIAEGVTNRVVLLSDGVANTGQTDQDRITADVKEFREKGIYLNTIGVGMGNHNDVFLEQLANKGDGLCSYIDDEAEAKKHLVDDFVTTFQPIARDVKIQVAFDPVQVESYRLLGYENRAIADVDFRNDAVDAGEIGSGHQVTALYELSRYGSPSDSETPIATATIRWKAPYGTDGEDEATERSRGITASEASGSFEGTTAGYRRAVLVAQFAEFLRRSVHARDDSLDQLIEEADKLRPEVEDPAFDEFVAMVKRSRELILTTLGPRDELARALDLVRENHLLRARIQDLLTEEDAALRRELDRLEERNRELDLQLRDILRRRLETPR